MGPNLIYWCHYKKEKIGHRDRHALKEELHMNMKAEIWVMHLQAKELQGLPAATRH